MLKHSVSTAVMLTLLLFSTLLSAKTVILDGTRFSVRSARIRSYSAYGTLSKSVTYKGFKLKSGGKITWNPKKQFLTSAILAATKTVRKGGFTFRFRSGKKIEFGRTYRGNVYFKAAILKKPMTIRIRKNRVKIKGRVAFYSKGNLLSVKLNGNQTLKRSRHSFTYAGGSSLMLTSSGKIDCGMLKDNQNIKVGKNSIPVRGKHFGLYSISFGYKGNISILSTSRDFKVKVRGKRYSVLGKSTIVFHSNGKVKKIKAGKRKYIHFTTSGSVKKISRY